MIDKALNHVIFAAILACAIVVTFRSTMKASDFRVFSAELLAKKIEQTSSGRTERYALVLTLAHRAEKVGVFIGTKEQALSDDLIDKMVVGEMYRFWIDPTVMTLNNINLGIRKIAIADGIVLYEASMPQQFWVGLCMTIFTAGMWMYSTKNKKGKKNR